MAYRDFITHPMHPLNNKLIGELEMLRIKDQEHNKYLERLSYYPSTLEDAFDMTNPNCVKYCCFEDHYMYEESVRRGEEDLAALDWHHIEPVTEEELELVHSNTIDRLLKINP